MNKKLKEIINALKQVKEKTIIICGPSKSGKTTILEKALTFLNLKIEYIQNIKHFRGKILSKKIAYTELEIDDIMSSSKNRILNHKICNEDILKYQSDFTLDSQKFLDNEDNFNSHENNFTLDEDNFNFDEDNFTLNDEKDRKINSKKKFRLFLNTRNLIIETRSFNLHRYIGNSIVIKFQKDEFYHYLGKLFYSKDDAFKYFDIKMIGFVFENYPQFINLENSAECMELISAGYDYAVLLYFWKCEKNKQRKFFSFKSPEFL
ncbi:hypothetical protein DMUE_0344 [Dictyocoela muelleri]|nr:hypothetical protein DMUE_0344 [Dictyocoela muelleri]